MALTKIELELTYESPPQAFVYRDELSRFRFAIMKSIRETEARQYDAKKWYSGILLAVYKWSVAERFKLEA